MQTRTEKTEQPRSAPVPITDDGKIYNYPHLLSDTIKQTAQRVIHPVGPHPGEAAPDFSLEDSDGRTWRSDELKGHPVLLVICSATCPMTQGSLPGLKSLYSSYRHHCQWLSLYVREAHPGERFPAHESMDQKRRQAQLFKATAGVSWPVLVDELGGDVHRLYGLLPNSVFLIDAQGIVSFVGEVTYAPVLRQALDHLLLQNMSGTVPELEDRQPHPLGTLVHGWDAIERGGQGSADDIIERNPWLALALLLGRRSRRVLGPLTRRTKKIPAAVKLLGGAAVGLSVYGLGRLISNKLESGQQRDSAQYNDRYPERDRVTYTYADRNEPELSLEEIEALHAHTDDMLLKALRSRRIR